MNYEGYLRFDENVVIAVKYDADNDTIYFGILNETGEEIKGGEYTFE